MQKVRAQPFNVELMPEHSEKNYNAENAERDTHHPISGAEFRRPYPPAQLRYAEAKQQQYEYGVYNHCGF